MATFYVDLENGNDANNGTTFALRKRNLSAITAAAGDTIRVMASPAATSLGVNGTWTNRKITSASISSSTNATPISITTSANHGFSTGDTVCITGHTTNTNANGTWTITVTGSTTFTLNTSVGTATGGATGTVYNITGRTVTLASAVTQTITSTGGSASGVGGGNRTAWTGVTNSPASQVSDVAKESRIVDQLAPNTTFTTGIIGYRTLPSSLNLSGFQQISLWIRQTAGTLLSASNLSIRLCSDTLGSTVVNSGFIPAMTALSTWYPITIDVATNLGSNINSVSFSLASDQGAQTFQFCNIIACKASSAADSLTLQSLIGKNDGVWYAIQSIDGTRVVLDQYAAAYPTLSTQRKYGGTTETVTTYKKEAIKPAAAVSNTSSGSAGNLITISGGWNRTDMSTQTDETALDGLYRVGPLYSMASGTNYQNISGFSLFRTSSAGTAFSSSQQTGCVIDFNCINASNQSALQFAGQSSTVTVANLEFGSNSGLVLQTLATSYGNTYGVDYCTGFLQTGISVGEIGSTISTIGTIDNCQDGLVINYDTTVTSITAIKNCVNSAISLNSSNTYDNIRIENVGTLTDNGVYAFASLGFGRAYIANGSTSGTGTFVTQVSGNTATYFRNVDFGESSSIWFSQTSGTTRGGYQVYLEDNNGVDYIYYEQGNIQSDTTTRNTASGKSWALRPTGSIRHIGHPLRLRVAQAAVAASNLVTVTAWVRRDNTGISGRLIVPGGQIAGVNETSADISAAANTWQQLTLTFTPSAAGVFELQYWAWGGTTFTTWIDDVSITQA